MKQLKLLISSMLLLLFVGCGGSGASSSTGGSTAENTAGGSTSGGFSGTLGVVVDPYIVGATFYYDKNSNGVRDGDEPVSTASDANGRFSFDEQLPSNARVVMQDKGTHLGVEYEGTLKANLKEQGVVSPLTTLEVEYPNSIDSMLITLGIEKEDIYKDPIANKDENPDLVAATVAIDSFLKIDQLNDVTTESDTLMKIVNTAKEVLENSATDENIENLVKVVSRVVTKAKEDGNLAELNKLYSDETYRGNVKNTLKTLTVSEANVVSDLGEDGTKVVYDSKLLNDSIFSFTVSPKKDIETVLSLNTDIPNDTEVTWEVITEPTTSALSLVKSAEQNSVTFIPSVIGIYTIQATSTTTGGSTSTSKKSISFSVEEEIALDTSGVKVLDNKELDEAVGTVSNQSWVSSKSLNETDLRTVVGKYTSFTVVTYDMMMGLLVQYDHRQSASREDLENLKLESGIDSVFNRVYAGDNAYETSLIEPDDNGAFNDGGSNWHLEAINMPEAWEYTTGDSDILVGISDAGYDSGHSDIQGRFASILTLRKDSHGMGVTGAMIANSDNGQGISGINWESQAVVSYMGGQYVKDVITASNNGREVRLINNSWGYRLPIIFNPNDSAIAQKRFDDMQSIYAQIRQLVVSLDNKLFIWAAGNGIGNGAGNNVTPKIYGVDAKYNNGALHYKNGVLEKLDNLFVVGAFVQDSRANTNADNKRYALTYYSEYGQSVDIAAPTRFDSLNDTNGIYQNFSGTSAAAPIVSAVASLVYSINPKLTASEVKNILISSATSYITQRQSSPTGSLEFLAHPIPIVNAREALKKAQATIENNIVVRTELTNHITPTLKLNHTATSGKYVITSIEVDVKSSDKQADYVSIGTKSTTTNEITVTLDPNKRYHKIVSTIHLKHNVTQEEITKNIETDYSYSDVTLKTIDNVSLDALANVALTISKLNSAVKIESTSNENGILKVYVEQGTYRIQGTLENYESTVKDLTLQADISRSIELPLTSSSQNEQGSISGYVTSESGIAVQNALVRISGGVLTNGYFSSAMTDENGYYKITSISRTAANTDPTKQAQKIESFTMSASQDGYITYIRDNVIVLAGKERVENFTLLNEGEKDESDVVLTDNFEGDISSWTVTNNDSNVGWRVLSSDDNISNALVCDNNNSTNNNYVCVNLAPDDDNNRVTPLNGKAFWYGSNSGNYITDYGSNNGTLVSKKITLPSETTTLSFKTWWEIESVNPNKDGYDLMEIYIISENSIVDDKCLSFEAWRSANQSKIDAYFNKFSFFLDESYKEYLIQQWYENICFSKKYSQSETGTLVKKLNPAIDPPKEKNQNYNDASLLRIKKPFSSAGFNRKPVWNTEEIDLSDYSGQTIQIKFKFNTVDAYYNGFRGWMIDNIEIRKNSQN